MAEYRLMTLEGYVQHVVPGEPVVTIPPAPGNADFDRYQAWLAAGNTPDPVTQPIDPELNSLGTGKTTNQILGVE